MYDYVDTLENHSYLVNDVYSDVLSVAPYPVYYERFNPLQN